MLVRGKLLPKTDQSQVVNEVADTPNTLIKQYDLKKHIQRVFVPKNASIVDKKLEDIKLSTNYHSIVLKIERTANDGFSLLPHPHVQEMAGPNSIIQANDILYIQGTNEQIQRFAEDHGLTIKNGKKEEFISSEIGVAEVLLTPDSRLINKTVAESGFRKSTI